MADLLIVPFTIPPMTTTNTPSPPPTQNALGLYEQYQGDLPPAWLQRPRGRAWNEASGKTKDEFIDAVTDAVQARFLQTAPPDALPFLAGDRLLEKYPQETSSIFRTRIAGAWEVWEFAGTVYGLEQVLLQAGWAAQILEHWRTDTSIWAEFSVFVQPSNPTPSANWDAANWDEFNWDYNSNALALAQLLPLIGKFKAAHSKLRELWFVESGTAFWDTANWDEFNWEGSSSFRVFP
jgi:hypothetical protein